MKSEKELQEWLMEWIATETKISVDSINLDRSFADYGLDSLEAAMLAGDLSDLFPEAYFEPDMFWDIKNIRELADFIVNEVLVAA